MGVTKLTFLYAPTRDLDAAIGFYRDTLGWDEAWREGDETVVFQIPDTEVQLMVSVDTGPSGPIYLVDDVAEFLASRPGLTVVLERMEIPDGAMAAFTDPAGNTAYVLDQAGAA